MSTNNSNSMICRIFFEINVLLFAILHYVSFYLIEYLRA